jgi:hypothetical protein
MVTSRWERFGNRLLASRRPTVGAIGLVDPYALEAG